jgi:hypothetical protein
MTVHMELKIVYDSPIESNNLSLTFHMERYNISRLCFEIARQFRLSTELY